MTVQFRAATRADVGGVLGLLIDYGLGRSRESEDMALYETAFDVMQADANNCLIVGERDGWIVATYQITYIAGLSLRFARRGQLESVRVASDLRSSVIC
jgi:hypothetical protein